MSIVTELRSSSPFEQQRLRRESGVKILQQITDTAVQVFVSGETNLQALNPDKLIRRVIPHGTIGELQQQERSRRPIRELFPYYDQLISLGIKPHAIESHFYFVSKKSPLYFDPSNPTELGISQDLFDLLTSTNPTERNGSSLVIARAITLFNLLNAPEPQEVEDQLKPVVREILRKRIFENFLPEIIGESGHRPKDKAFYGVIKKINEDLDSKTTRFVFYGGAILGLLDKQQPPDGYAFGVGSRLQDAVINLLAQAACEAVFNALYKKRPELETDSSIREFRVFKEEAMKAIAEEGLDFGFDPNNHGVLLGVYLESTLPRFIMGNNEILGKSKTGNLLY